MDGRRRIFESGNPTVARCSPAIVLLCVGLVCSGRSPLSSAPAPVARASVPVARESAPVAPEGRPLQSQLRPPLEGRGTALLAGRVVDADTGEPIEGARVTLIGASGGPTAGGVPAGPIVITDSLGRFYFANLAPGPYVPLPSREGYVAVFSGQSINLYQSVQFTDVRLRRLGTIAGALHDDAGDPVVGTEVIAYRRTIQLPNSPLQPGRAAQFTRMASDRSDNRGAYRLRNLSAGEYFICACNRDPIPFDGPLLTTLASRPLELAGIARRAAAVGADAATIDETLHTFAPTFHPNATVASRATGVTIGPGEQRTGVDISLTAVRAVRVSGVLFGGTGTSVSSATMRLVPANDLPEAGAITQFFPMVLQPDGRFDFAGIPPGQYTLVVQYDSARPFGGPSGNALRLLGQRGLAFLLPSGPPSGLPSVKLWASERIAVGNTDVTGLAVVLKPRPNVRGRIEYAGSPPPAVHLNGVALAPVGPSLFPPESGNISLFQDRSFEILHMMPGRYVPLLTRSTSGWRLASIALRGVDVTDAAIEIESRDVDDLVFTLTSTPPSSLEITTHANAGEILEDMQVCLFPADRRYWAEPLAAHRRFGAQRFGTRMSFEFRNLPSGEYYVAVQRSLAGAQGNGPSFDWVNPTGLEDLARSAERVRLLEGESKVVVLRR